VTPILTDHAFEIVTHSPAQTTGIGERLGRLLRGGDVICLQGDLGTGKTCLTQGIGQGLSVAGTINSPTFVYINEHAPCNDGPYLYHVDLYRIHDFMDALALGIEDYLYGDGVTVIEWAERALDIIPAERLWITLAYLDYSKRSIQFSATGERYLEILIDLKRELFSARGPALPGQ
jgi:tRNA threonylcarbamoyladenosine biosynthesis protein TsaE